MVIMKRFILVIFFVFVSINETLANTDNVEIYADACEKIIEGESKSSARLRASDKATFIAVKKIKQIDELKDKLSDHDLNVMIYRFVDEYVEDLSVQTIQDEGNKICVEVKGRLNLSQLNNIKAEFIKPQNNDKENTSQEIKEIVEEVKQEIKIRPENPENLALVCVKKLEYFNCSTSLKYANILKKHIDGNPYFYLTEDSEIADYVITPKVLKAKVDSLDASNKRLHMALVLEIEGMETEIVSEYQNRFVLFGAEENEQKIASRLIGKLMEQAGDGVVRKIEHKEQQKLESKVLGRTLNQ